MHLACLTLSIFNLACFAAGTWTVFEHSKENKRWNGFGVAWIATSGILLFNVSQHPSKYAETLPVALCVLALSTLLFFSAWKTIRKRRLTTIFSSDAPSWLYSTGPYRYIRHPFYASYLLTYLAILMTTQTPMACVAAVAMSAVYVAAAMSEERKFANSDLADQYRVYRSQSGMFFPHLRKG